MEAVRDWRKLAKSFEFHIPAAIQQRITKHHATEKKQSLAAGEWWVNTVSYPSWDNLANVLYHNGEDTALEKMARYLPKGASWRGYYTLSSLLSPSAQQPPVFCQTSVSTHASQHCCQWDYWVMSYYCIRPL